MRWKVKPTPKRKEGDTRIRKSFLLIFPKCINNEWRWLEPASWEEKLYLGTCSDVEGKSPYACLKWAPTRWIKE